MNTNRIIITAALLTAFSGCEAGNNPSSGSIEWDHVYDNTLPTLAFVKQNNTIIAMQFGGIRRSTNNGEGWVSCPISPGVEFQDQIATYQDNAVFVAGGGFFVSTDNGIKWNKTSDSLFLATAVDSAGNLFSIVWNGGVKSSFDGGKIWKECTVSLSELRPKTMAVNNRNLLFVGTELDGVFRSSNGGESWTRTMAGIDTGYRMISYIAAINRILYVRAMNRTADSRIYFTLDDGLTWNEKNGFRDCHQLYCGPDTILVVDWTCFSSTDGGLSWHSLGPYGQDDLNALSAGLAPDNHLLIGSNIGIYRSKKTLQQLLR